MIRDYLKHVPLKQDLSYSLTGPYIGERRCFVDLRHQIQHYHLKNSTLMVHLYNEFIIILKDMKDVYNGWMREEEMAIKILELLIRMAEK